MDKKALRRLEFPKILDKLAGYARTSPGKEVALNLKPIACVETIKRLQDETTEGTTLFRLEPGADMYGWFDIRKGITRVRRGAVLEAKEFYEIGQTIASSRRIKKFILDRQDRYPLLADLASGLESFATLEKDILKSISPSGEVLDEASPALSQIRRKSVRLQEKIRERLEHIIRSPQYMKYLQDPIVTIREGRYVIPVKQEYRSSVPGIIHDQSASGATLFVEPMGIVDSNNEVRRLGAEEKLEIQRILKAFSIRVQAIAESLDNITKTLGYLDFIMAKANLSIELNASSPLVSEGPSLDLKRARHPLLTGKVVPIDVQIGRNFSMLIITGPNTGGKTVALKTVGLLVLMSQAGLHIPVEVGTSVGVFSRVYADIGDEQSIEQSLSTFSSHMSNIVEIISNACPESLVLLDELGAGTDPSEGSALARAILGKLNEMGAKVIATTHFTELKNYAYTTAGVENASVQFDLETLRPTYQLLTGRPGSSNAFEIANRLGVSDRIIEKARGFLTTEQLEMGEITKRLEKEYHEAEARNVMARGALQEAKKDKDKYERLAQELRASRDKALQDAREKARKIVKESEIKAEGIISELRSVITSGDNRAKEAAIRKAREQIKVLKSNTVVKRERPDLGDHGGALDRIIPGQEVFIPGLGRQGRILEETRDGEALVQVGIMKVNIPLHDLKAPGRTEKKKDGKTAFAGIMAGKSQDVSAELDLRGQYADEAISSVEKYLDDAILAGLKRAVLIHGKGTGALRLAVHDYLRKNPRVASYRLGAQTEGGFGVTVVELQ
ncbi:MAG TPA: endonuclease MutS2 [Clostridia bacterium]|nr:endonuclease MutS2 [Clostridia bacterium]